MHNNFLYKLFFPVTSFVIISFIVIVNVSTV
jgi:hypothetical protein